MIVLLSFEAGKAFPHLSGWRLLLKKSTIRKWIISSRHFANVIQSENDRDMVYGMVYKLTAEDERKLDVSEGVARGNYVKYDLPVVVNAGQPGEATLLALVYVDVKHQNHSSPHTEYIQRINLGVEDAINVGVPENYIAKYIRPFIPTPTPQIISAIAPDADCLVADLKDGDSTSNIECCRLNFSENQKVSAFLLVP
jgi:gamma-glutamylcyclotransferase